MLLDSIKGCARPLLLTPLVKWDENVLVCVRQSQQVEGVFIHPHTILCSITVLLLLVVDISNLSLQRLKVLLDQGLDGGTVRQLRGEYHWGMGGHSS